MNDLCALADLASAGDIEALNSAVELAERLVLEQELASAPAGIRTRALQAMANYHKQSRIRAKRQKLAEERNAERGEAVRAPIRKALENVSLHDKRMKALVQIVTNYLMRKGLDEFGLDECPCDETIKRVIRELKNN